MPFGCTPSCRCRLSSSEFKCFGKYFPFLLVFRSLFVCHFGPCPSLMGFYNLQFYTHISFHISNLLFEYFLVVFMFVVYMDLFFFFIFFHQNVSCDIERCRTMCMPNSSNRVNCVLSQPHCCALLAKSERQSCALFLFRHSVFLTSRII